MEKKPTRETLEQAAENKYGLSDKYFKNRIGFVEGAKWQADRSEEDLRTFERILIYDDDKTDTEKIEEVLKVIQYIKLNTRNHE